MTLTPRSVTRRFLLVSALRWLPVGLVIPVTVLLPLERGLSLTEVGTVAALQGAVVLALELPTGGLADSLGRRRVLLLAAVVGAVALAVLLTAETVAAFAVVWALQGVHRALDSGPLEAWYVDAVQAADPAAPIEKGLSAQGTVLGLAIAGGALAGGGLVAWDPLPGVEALVVPVVAALTVQVLTVVGIAVALVEEPRGRVWRSLSATPRAVADGVRLLRGSAVLMALVAVELTWGFGLAALESLTPVRLAEVIGDTEAAAALTGPATSAAWLASAAGAALLPALARRTGLAPAAALLRILQGVAVVAIGLVAGVAGIVTAYLVAYVAHGASNPAHMTLLHRQVGPGHRATVVSLNSMAAQPAGAVGILVLTAVADGTSLSSAMVVAGGALLLGAPLYVPAWRQARASRQAAGA
ncbi:MFS transporter [Georgenia sp. M64]|uniref:MFS transporter n=1 Tax=Georgenia sp. M64 TaxID=3120520 RepID=UPI0030DE9154